MAGLHRQPAEQLEVVAAIRAAVVERFPLDSWPSMVLEQYAMGAEAAKQNFCWTLEVETRGLGSISGGSAAKFGIFSHNSGEWRYPQVFTTPEQAWAAIRTGFCSVFEFASASEWGEAATVTVPGVWPSVVLKALHIYFPEHVLPVFAQARLQHYAKIVGVDPELPPLSLNLAVTAALRATPELADASLYELMCMLEAWRPPAETQRGGGTSGSSVYLKVSPGEQASEWDDCVRYGYICVGWDELGDLSLYDSPDDIAEALSRTDRNATERSNKMTAKRLWTYRNLQPGNHVVANRGTTEVLGIGTVRDDGYTFLTDRAHYKHTVAVDWDTTFARKFDPGFGGWRATFQTLQKSDVTRILTPDDGAPVTAMAQADAAPVYSDAERQRFATWAKAIERKKQIVLYGPPGTGKTYSARRFARWYADGHSGGWHDRALTLVTFHASYTYEEFVEGYRPVDGDGSGGLRLALTDGLFKKVCADATADPDKIFVLLIDEINRANVPRVLGELMTVIEADKRGIPVLLPASQRPFAVPENLLIIGTMNTADRSIRTLDAALRRRFAFDEILPAPSLLETQTSGGSIPLALDVFLDELNRRITEHAGRDRQIGHAYFLQSGEPITDLVDFAQIIRLEVIPLLQELAYDDYTQLTRYLGPALVDAAAQRIVPVDDETLVDMLAAEYGAAGTQ